MCSSTLSCHSVSAITQQHSGEHSLLCDPFWNCMHNVPQCIGWDRLIIPTVFSLTSVHEATLMAYWGSCLFVTVMTTEISSHFCLHAFGQVQGMATKTMHITTELIMERLRNETVGSSCGGNRYDISWVVVRELCTVRSQRTLPEETMQYDRGWVSNRNSSYYCRTHYGETTLWGSGQFMWWKQIWCMIFHEWR